MVVMLVVVVVIVFVAVPFPAGFVGRHRLVERRL